MLFSQIEQVEYSEAWAKQHPNQARYIAGEGWSEQFEYYPEGEDEFEEDDGYEKAYADAELDAFLSKANEDEWISHQAGQPVVFDHSCIVGVMFDHIDAHTERYLAARNIKILR